MDKVAACLGSASKGLVWELLCNLSRKISSIQTIIEF